MPKALTKQTNLFPGPAYTHTSAPSLEPETYKGLYSMHKYWSKKPHNLVRAFIERYSAPGEIVLDPFVGSGITAIESLATDRRAVAIDLNPVATFITKATLIPVDIEELERAFRDIKTRFRPSVQWMYATVCPNCGSKASITHTIWKDDTPRTIWAQCSSCNTPKAIKEPSAEDLRLIEQISRTEIPHWYPQSSLIPNYRINATGATMVADLFSKRNLNVLASLYSLIDELPNGPTKEILRFTFTAALPQASKMVFVVKNRGKMSGNIKRQRDEVGSWVIGFWVPGEHFEIDVWNCFENRFRRIVKGKTESNLLVGDKFAEAEVFDELLGGKTALIQTGDATSLSGILDNSIDYVFTDPPHGDRIPYFELSLFWASWLRLPLDFEKEIVVSNAKSRNKDENDYKRRLERAVSEIVRVLKPGRHASFAFNNLGDETWLAFLGACSSAGLEVTDVSTMKYSANSVVQDSRRSGLKSDFVLTCRKPTTPSQKLRNVWIEDQESLVSSVLSVAANLCRDGGADTSAILNGVIPDLIRQQRAFRMSDIVKIIKSHLVPRGSKWALPRS